MFQEPRLHGQFEKYVEALLEVDDLESMFSGDIDGPVVEGKGGKCTTELIDLQVLLSASAWRGWGK